MTDPIFGQGRRTSGAAAPSVLLLHALLLALTTPGCQKPPPAATESSPGGAIESRDGDPLEHEIWYTISAQGKRLGFEHVRRRPDPTRDGSWVFESRQQISLSRDGDVALQAVELTSWESPSGELQRFEVAYDSGGERTVTSGRAVDGTLRLQTTMGQRTDTLNLAWPKDSLGLSAPLPIFFGRTPAPGQSGEYQTLAPVINQIVTAAWKAGASERVEFADGARSLLRVDVTLTLPSAAGLQLRQSLWLDPRGRPLRLVDHQTGLTWLEADRSAALAPPESAELDLNEWVSVPLDGDTPADPHACRRIRYRVSLGHGDPLDFFRSTSTQTIQTIDQHTAELHVSESRLRPRGAKATSAPNSVAAQPPANETTSPPTPADLSASALIQCDDDRIRQMAETAAGDLPNELAVAEALEQFVHGHIRNKSYGKAFQSAAEVAVSREGDCTEHAVLLAALCRSRKIPARVVTGIVYHRNAFAYHMWNEAWIEGAWRPLDATLANGGIGPAHLSFKASPLEGADALAELLPVMGVMGDLKIKVLDADQ